jgi:hypothetical protein
MLAHLVDILLVDLRATIQHAIWENCLPFLSHFLSLIFQMSRRSRKASVLLHNFRCTVLEVLRDVGFAHSLDFLSPRQ